MKQKLLWNSYRMYLSLALIKELLENKICWNRESRFERDSELFLFSLSLFVVWLVLLKHVIYCRLEFIFNSCKLYLYIIILLKLIICLSLMHIYIYIYVVINLEYQSVRIYRLRLSIVFLNILFLFNHSEGVRKFSTLLFCF